MNRCRLHANAFTLLEVILALAVLAVSLAIIGEANSSADRNAHRAAAESEATLVAESVIAELVAGTREPAPVDRAPWEDAAGEAPRWVFSIALAEAPVSGLVQARVTVEQAEPLGAAAVRVTLTRWLADSSAGPAGGSAAAGGLP